MAVTIEGNHRDRRIDRILADPKAYFDQARRRAEAKVRSEMEQEKRSQAKR